MACLSSEDAAECRRRHVRILENLRDRGSDERVRRLKVDNAVVSKYILAPVHASAPWLHAAAGFDGAEIDSESGAAACLVAPVPEARRACRAGGVGGGGWPDRRVLCAAARARIYPTPVRSIQLTCRAAAGVGGGGGGVSPVATAAFGAAGRSGSTLTPSEPRQRVGSRWR